FADRTSDDREGRHPGDPVNLVLLGTGEGIDSAFDQAGWVRAERPGLRSLARGVTATIMERPAVGAPVSTQYFEGRKQDLAFELSGPNARMRHHLRIWQLDGADGVWVGAADQDIGLVVKPFRRSATHRIAPDVDLERDLIVQVLEASGCSDLLAYTDVPDAITSGRNASGQRFHTDGRIAVLRMKPCR
ncbi:MAG TPA: LssY C-terminal domain-containing protein, partial [Longimicrobiales bacterium]